MSELTKLITQITIIFAKEFSDALLTIASKISAIESKTDPIIVSKKPNIESLQIGYHVTFDLKNGKRFGGYITKIDGDLIDAANHSMKQSWTISKSQVIDVSDGDFYYHN